MFKSAYFEYKARASVECPENPWRVQNSALFGRLDRFLERCHDVREFAEVLEACRAPTCVTLPRTVLWFLTALPLSWVCPFSLGLPLCGAGAPRVPLAGVGKYVLHSVSCVSPSLHPTISFVSLSLPSPIFFIVHWCVCVMCV